MIDQNEVVHWRIKAQSFVYVKNQSQFSVRGHGHIFVYRLWDDFFLSEQSVSHDFVRGEQVASVLEDFDATWLFPNKINLRSNLLTN